MFDFACASGRGSRLYLAYFRYILSAIYYPIGLFSVFRQSEENFRSLSKFGHSTEEIYFGTCLHLGNSSNSFFYSRTSMTIILFQISHVGSTWVEAGERVATNSNLLERQSFHDYFSCLHGD